jgi:hypothetical protein
VERHRVEGDRQAGDGQELLQLAREVEDAAVDDVVERADPERVPDQGEPPPVAVPQGAGERPVERVEAVGARLQPVGEDGGRRRDRRRQRAGAGPEVRAGAVDPGRLAGPPAPPAIPEATPGTATTSVRSPR